MKRILDISAALLGLLLIWPLLVCLAVWIAISDGFPVFFRQERIGRHGKPFRMWKFRTMVRNAESLGRPLTVGRDPRITRVGHFLRRTKLDELPQLFNVLRGEMSLVGPRPEVSRYVDQYTDQQRAVLELVPGITDPASIRYCREAELLERSDAPEQLYVQTIMPEKIRLNLEYAKHRSLTTDLRVILMTIQRLVARRQGQWEDVAPIPPRDVHPASTGAAWRGDRT